MRRLFGRKKKKVVEPPKPKDPFNFDKHQNKVDGMCDKTNDKLAKVQEEIQVLYSKMKKTAIRSEKTYIKNRLKQLLMKRKHLTKQLSRYTNQQMMVDKVKYNKEMVDDTMEMGKCLKDANETQQEAMKNFDIDEFQDAMEDMEDLAYENDRIAEMVNEQFDVEVDDDLDEELADLENELEVQEMMKNEQTNKVQTNKN